MSNKETAIVPTNEVPATKETFALSTDMNFGDELQGLKLVYERIKVPAGGGLAYEVPGDDAESPDMVKEFKAVVLHSHPVNAFYKEKFNGGNESPDCSSTDGKMGTDKETGEIKQCKHCPNNQWGSGEGEKGKACKEKRRMFLLLEGNVIPVVFTLPTTSIPVFELYATRLLGRGKAPSRVVTKFSLKKDTSTDGIVYSKVVLNVERDLTATELSSIQPITQQVKSVGAVADDGDE